MRSVKVGLVAASAVASVCCFAVPPALADPPVPPSTAGAAKPDVTKPDVTKQDVATLLFSDPQWDKAPVGSTITYSYVKKTDKLTFRAPFEDHILLMLDKGRSDKARSIEVQMFSGTHRKAAGPFASEEQNPVLLLAMEENVQELSKLFKANPRYLKNAIRKAWRDDATIVDAPVEVDGKSVPGTKITVTPFANDPEKDKMMGLSGITYTVEIADSVPGNIAAVDIYAPKDGTPIFSETLRYQGDKK